MEANTTSSPNYTTSPQDVVTKAFVDCVEALAEYEEENLRYGSQVTAATATQLTVAYNRLRRLVGDDIEGNGLGKENNIVIGEVGKFLKCVKLRGYFNTQMVIAQ